MIDFDDLDVAEADSGLTAEPEPEGATEGQGASPKEAGEPHAAFLLSAAARCARERARAPVLAPGPRSKSRRRCMPGVFYGLSFPWSPGSLKALGPDWLTDAFRAAGTISGTCEATALKGIRCLGFRRRARQVLIEVEFREATGEAFHRDLLVKFPCFGLLGAEPAAPRPGAPSISPADRFAEVNFYRLFEAQAPLLMPRYYYGDVSDETENFMLVTEWVPEDGGTLDLDAPQRCFLRGFHGSYLACNPADGGLFMSSKRKEWETWALRPVDGGRRHQLRAWSGGYLATSGAGEQEMLVSPERDDAARWLLVEASGPGGHRWLRSKHQTYLSSLKDAEQTLYMSPNAKDWEKWRPIPVDAREARPAASCRHLDMQEAGYDTFHAMVAGFAKLAALQGSGLVWGTEARPDELEGSPAEDAVIKGPAAWANREFLDQAGLAQDFICAAGDAVFPPGVVTNLSMQRYRSMLVTARSNLEEINFFINHIDGGGVALGMDYFDLDSAFERNTDGRWREGLRHWDSLSFGPLGCKLWKLFSFARPDVLLHHRNELLETFVARYHQCGGPLLRWDLLHAQFMLAACLESVLLLEVVPEFYGHLPREEWPSVGSLQDPRLAGHLTTQGSLWARLKSFANIFLLLEHFDIKAFLLGVLPLCFQRHAIGRAQRLQAFQVRAAAGAKAHSVREAAGPLLALLPHGSWVITERYFAPVCCGGVARLQMRFPIPGGWVAQDDLEPAPSAAGLVAAMEQRENERWPETQVAYEDMRSRFDMSFISQMYRIRRFYTGSNAGGMAEISSSMLHSRWTMFHAPFVTFIGLQHPRIVRGSFLAQRRARAWWPTGYEDWAHHSFLAFEDGSIADVTADQFDDVPQLWWPADASRYAFDFRRADEANRLRRDRIGLTNWTRMSEEDDAAEGRSRYPWWTVEWHTTMRLPPKGGLVLRHNEPVELPPVARRVEVGGGRPSVTFRRLTAEHELEVWLIEGLFQAQEVQRLVRCCEARQGFQPSLTKSTAGQVVTDSRRTSSTCPIFFPHLCEEALEEMRQVWGGEGADEELEAAGSAAALCAGALEVDVSRIEPLQMVKYAPGQHYLPHLDAHQEPGRLSSFCGEQRLQTLLVFMTDVPEADGGGHLHFPHLGLRVLPRAGSAVLWSNVKRGSLEPNPDSLHEGVAPLSSGKVAMNVWIVDRPLSTASILSGRRRGCAPGGRGRGAALSSRN